MNREEILAMEVGEELNKLIAVEVMAEPAPKFISEDALELQLAGDPIKSPKECWLCLCEYDQGDVPTWRPLPFSTDISAAWQVVERMEELGFYFKLDSWQVNFYASGRDMDKNAVKFDSLIPKSVCPAICKAALLARQ